MFDWIGFHRARNQVVRLCHRIHQKVAMARRLAIALYWMSRKGWDYERVKKFGSHAGQLEPGRGVQ
jgi:hypothetical protein